MRIGLLFDRVDCDEAGLADQLAGWEVADFRDWRSRPGELLARCRSVDVLVTGKHSPVLPEALADDSGRLRYICHTRGVVKVYVPRRVVESGVVLSNWGDAPTAGVAELALALLLAQLHQLHLRDRLSRGGGVPLRWQAYPTAFAGLRVGVYGCGCIGRRFAGMCRALGMAVTAYDPWAAVWPDGVARATDLDALFAGSHAVSIHAGLSEATSGSVDANRLARLPDGGILVNTARGGIVDEVALAAEVASGRLLAACDVIADEADWSSSPLAATPVTLLTGHGMHRAAAPSDKPAERWSLPAFAVENLRAWREGREVANRIDLPIYDRTT
jgi:phosphoglycerate dehydrogenase-like enzyme